MSDLWESAVNFYRLRLVPTIKRMLDRRRFSYTLLTVGVLTVCAAALSLLVSYAAQSVTALDALAEEYELYLVKFLSSGNKRSPMPEMREAADGKNQQEEPEILRMRALSGLRLRLLGYAGQGKMREMRKHDDPQAFPKGRDMARLFQ